MVSGKREYTRVYITRFKVCAHMIVQTHFSAGVEEAGNIVA